ncbi:DNA polymerase-3 subunit gamma/tau [Hydrogenophaga palleronii]|uniref:DNA polymerase III subunit gamma/tau n=1 Tax=Hydrogenophaga palleronii TaxID=65655 RepID=A0ABU1WJN0_9BURK|nr:DNA polymerase III subunit gamma/tau [Hydrogenophaga palleronii]MDR7149466.1 DNA polymerase-3 subunit gamma/tau [Hydrogenophaga palleronii]
MSYVVLARKYRPRNFSEMVGQSHVVQALSNALTTQRLHHAYLFTGTRGVGKTTVSRILAKSLNCLGADGQGGITAEPCGVCQACTDIDSGRFVDYTELDAASNRGVDEIQALLEQAVYKPVQGRFKVFMIDEVHMLTNTAFNAMLKTLEEPPEYLKFVLATTDPQKVPVTVLSRCLQFNLRPMAPETVLEHLQQVLQSEAVDADTPSLRLLSRAARGSMRDALSLTDQAIAFGGGRLQEATVRQMLGAVDRSYVLRLIDALARADGATVVDTVDTMRVNGLNAASALEEMTGVLQRMAVMQAVPGKAAEQDFDDPDAGEMLRLAQLLPADETQLLYSLCLHGRGELGLAPDEYAALTMVLLRLLAFKPASNVSAVQPNLAEKKTLKTDAEKVGAASPQPVALAQVVATTAPPAVPAAVRAFAPAIASQDPTPSGLAKSLATAPSPTESTRSTPAINKDVGTYQEDIHADVEVEDDHPPWDEIPPSEHAAQATRQVVSVPVRDPGMSERLEQRHTQGAERPTNGVQRTAEGDFWFDTVMALARAELISALVRELGLQSQLVARDAEQWVLRVERESLNQGNNRDRLAAALKAHGHDVRLVVEIGRVLDSPALRVAEDQQRRQQEAERVIRDDPFVQSMMRDFGGRIVPGTLKAISV